MIAAIERDAATTPVNLTVERFIRQSSSRLTEFIRRRVSTREEAEDLAQDVLLSLTLNFDPTASTERLTAWLFTAARNRVIDWYRSRRVSARSLDSAADPETGEIAFELPADPGEAPDELLDRVLFQEALAKALAELPPEQREVFVKHELEGKSFREIAAETGASQSALLSRKFYAIRKLRRILRDFR